MEFSSFSRQERGDKKKKIHCRKTTRQSASERDCKIGIGHCFFVVVQVEIA